MRSIVSRAGAVVLVGLLAAACSSAEPAAGTADPSPEAGSSSTSSSGGSGTGTSTEPSKPEGPSCSDGKKNAGETDVDCGGASCAACPLLGACATSSDCVAGAVCLENTCAGPNANDGVKDGDESDVDCGGAAAPGCNTGKHCGGGPDCKDQVCTAGTCAAPSPTDGVKNGTETDVDCGGAGAPACADTRACNAGPDCASQVCTAGACAAPTRTDNKKNGPETDVDCGGGGLADACVNGKGCLVGGDCTSLVCTGNVCQAPTGSDTVKNGDETDVDCGGTTTGAPKCAATKACKVHADCASDGCDYTGKCAVERSCTTHLGGDTCGTGEVGALGSSHESCCVTAPLAGSAAKIDKYGVTAGRMRAFVERTAGNTRAVAEASPGWSTAWSPYTSTTVAEADKMLGALWFDAPNDSDVATNPWSKRSCNPGSFGGHTYATPGADGATQSFTATQLDPKALNCVGWHMAKAFCAFDHGRLPTRAELVAAFKNNGSNSWPWQPRDMATYPVAATAPQDFRLNHEFNYGYPGAAPMNGGTVRDIAWYVSPPGRFTAGRNASGVEDMAGNLLHWASDYEYEFVWTGSWEGHAANLNGQNWKSAWPGEPNGYYAIGFRCVHD
ncbi:MAG: Tryptophan synthase alpha chain [Labilithrix sp.]|nr:Tryptophan synthase alpha chain [Labilithrix sp.]